MILDCRTDSFIGPMILIFDAETGEPFEREQNPDLLYVDTQAGIYRVAARDEGGNLLRDEEGDITWTEHRRRLKIIPDPDLEPIQLGTVEEWLETREREGYPTFELGAPATFQEAMDEAEIEAACEELGLDDETSEFVMASHRFSPGYLQTILKHGGDHDTYVRCKLILRASLDGKPEPTFPPRP